MAFHRGPKIVTDGLVLALDAGNSKSYSGSGTVISDLSGSDNNGNLENGVGYSTDNIGSFIFDGIDDYIQTNNTIDITGNMPRTFECWSYITISARKNVMGGGDSGNGNLFDTIIWTNGSYLQVIGHYYGPGFDTISTLPSRNTINLNEWNHIVHIYDGTDCILYTNGLFSNSKTLELNTTNNYARLGAGIFNNYNYQAGKAGLFRIYNRALTSTEVLQNYNSTKSRYEL